MSSNEQANEQSSTPGSVKLSPESQPTQDFSKTAVPPASTSSTGAVGNAAAGQRALLAKRLARGPNPSIVSPTDNLMTPVSAKLSQAKKKHFTKGGPIKAPSFGQKLAASADDDDDDV